MAQSSWGAIWGPDPTPSIADRALLISHAELRDLLCARLSPTGAVLSVLTFRSDLWVMEGLGEHLCKAPSSSLLRLLGNNHSGLTSAFLAPGTVLGAELSHPFPAHSPLLAFLRQPCVMLSWGDSMSVVTYQVLTRC